MNTLTEKVTVRGSKLVHILASEVNDPDLIVVTVQIEGGRMISETLPKPKDTQQLLHTIVDELREAGIEIVGDPLKHPMSALM